MHAVRCLSLRFHGQMLSSGVVVKNSKCNSKLRALACKMNLDEEEKTKLETETR